MQAQQYFATVDANGRATSFGQGPTPAGAVGPLSLAVYADWVANQLNRVWNATTNSVTTPAPSPAQLLAYASNAQNNCLAQVWTFNVAASGAQEQNVTTKLDAAGSQSVNEIGTWVALNAAASPPPTMPYNNVDGSCATLTYAEAASLAQQAGALKMGTYALLNTVSAAIMATPPTITTYAQIDAAGWPVAGTPGA